MRYEGGGSRHLVLGGQGGSRRGRAGPERKSRAHRPCSMVDEGLGGAGRGRPPWGKGRGGCIVDPYGKPELHKQAVHGECLSSRSRQCKGNAPCILTHVLTSSHLPSRHAPGCPSLAKLPWAQGMAYAAPG